MSLSQPATSELVTVSLYQHRCVRCFHTWTSKLARPSCCPSCKDPRYDKPKRWSWKGKRRNRVYHHKVGDKDDLEHYSPRIREQIEDERRRDDIIRAMYPDKASATTAIFNRDAICISLSFKNRTVQPA